MDNSNFERAKKLTENWPSWKREYQLTKNHEQKQELSPSSSRSPDRHDNSSEQHKKR